MAVGEGIQLHLVQIIHFETPTIFFRIIMIIVMWVVCYKFILSFKMI